MSQRQEWLFEYPVGLLRQAAQERMEYHRVKLAHWREEEKRLEEAVRLSVRLQPKPGVTSGQTVMANVPVYDQTVVSELATAQGRAREHEQRLEEYRRWCILLEAESDRSFPLDFQDAQFFGISD